ncbi:hypothetical protein G4B88_027969 [Cannabis sativa]|uniref:non-specific serine/threonine protein kinase n=1 Tax=Cannabis sativa TaxID=3483 RepID=A0A7J6I845_CANSA|nr:hypothetical protein G4B88_027969 [Cannabis sativa]
MGNCLEGRSKVDNSLSSRTSTSGTTQSAYKSSNSLRLSNLTLPTNSEKSTSGSLPTPRSEGEILSSPHLKAFTLNELKNATRNFRQDNLIGEGGFGYVYKGWIDEHTLSASRAGSGIVVAIKKLKPEGFQGHKEWLSEVNYLGQLHHPNLVKLVGYCVDGSNRLLVYEYMPKGSLENHLFRRGARPLSWAKRIRVAVDAARGLSFLHNSKEKVIYRRLTAKCDVYSFGVVLLELLSGRHAVDKTKVGVEQNLVDWARPYLGDRRKLFRIMDTKLEGQYPQKGAFMVAILALQCIGEAKLRPQMSEVLHALEQLSTTKQSQSPSHSRLSTGSHSPVPPRLSSSNHSPVPKSPLKHNFPSPMNKSPRGSPVPHQLKSPRGL